MYRELNKGNMSAQIVQIVLSTAPAAAAGWARWPGCRAAGRVAAPCTHFPEKWLYAKFSDTNRDSSEMLSAARLPESRL